MSLEIKFFYINLYDMKSEVTLPYWLGKNLMTLPWIPPAHSPF